MRLSPHFTLQELTYSQTAARYGIDNSPNKEQLANLKQLCHEILEPVRVRLNNQPIFITSGFRCAALNGRINGSRNSAHLDGRAADFICPSFGDPEEVAVMLGCCDIEYDQLILEFGQWIHISHHPSNPRREILTAQYSEDGTVYRVGIV